LFTVFGYGCNLGPNQTAHHAPEIATVQALRRINAQHITADKLEAAMVDVIGQYVRFQLPRHWGSGRAAIADGTHVKLRENNLLGSRHIRYGGYGGIAYHHIADSYIALFTSFITCGVWEAVHILDALLKNRSEIQPDTLHADTQGQSEHRCAVRRRNRLGPARHPRAGHDPGGAINPGRAGHAVDAAAEARRIQPSESALPRVPRTRAR
jgi:TnpA family transposase